MCPRRGHGVSFSFEPPFSSPRNRLDDYDRFEEEQPHDDEHMVPLLRLPSKQDRTVTTGPGTYLVDEERNQAVIVDSHESSPVEFRYRPEHFRIDSDDNRTPLSIPHHLAASQRNRRRHPPYPFESR